MIEEAFSELMNLHHIYCEKSNRFHNQLWMYAHGIASMVATNFCDWDIWKVETMLTVKRLLSETTWHKMLTNKDLRNLIIPQIIEQSLPSYQFLWRHWFWSTRSCRGCCSARLKWMSWWLAKPTCGLWLCPCRSWPFMTPELRSAGAAGKPTWPWTFHRRQRHWQLHWRFRA